MRQNDITKYATMHGLLDVKFIIYVSDGRGGGHFD